jgi:predicted ATPase/DNA-binding SARP family transcriptional activator
MLEVRLIGKFDIQFDGKSVVLSSRAAQSLFAYLVLTAGTLHRREKLAGMLWPEESEQKARTYLRNELWRIRKALAQTSNAEYLLADNLTVGFNKPSAYWLDLAAFKNLSDTASAEELIEALSSYQGELLPGFYEDWVVLEREHLQVLFEQNIACLLDTLQKENRWDEILDWAERWILLGQAPEAAYRALMVSYDALGDHANVTSTYERCKQALRQLDLEPSEQTRALALNRNSKINIPIPLTSFIGREKELREVAALFSKSRLVTLTGSGGVGKTRLAIQVVAEVMDLFPDGVWFLDLSPLNDPARIPNTLASLLRLRELGEIPVTELLINYFRSRTALVIFDNCEHLIESCAELIHLLLISCEFLAVLATSRETLRVSGEIPYRVPSLRIPKANTEFNSLEISSMEAVKLFVERAAVVSPRFVLSQQNAVPIAQICQRLDGIPLAIELAAARMNMLAVEQILQHLDNRFNLLTNGLRSLLSRHRTLRATMEWSYELLSEPERFLFRRLAVFIGGWTLEAAEEICSGENIASAEMLELLSQLVNKSLVTVQISQNETRYYMLETLRQYSSEKLIESVECDTLHDKHLKYYLDLAETAEPHIIRPEQLEWLPLLDADYENLRLAFQWAMKKNSTELSLKLCTFLWWFWDIRGYWSEGSNWLAKALAKPQDDPSKSEKVARARALYTQSYFYGELGNFEKALHPAQTALVLTLETSDKRDIAIAKLLMGWALRLRGEVDDQASVLLEQSFSEFQELNDLFWQAQSFPKLGFLLARQGKLQFYEVCLRYLELARRAGERRTLAKALSDNAYILISKNRLAEAMKCAKESDTLYEQLGSKHTGLNLSWYADIAWIQGDYQKAKSFYVELQDHYRWLGTKSNISMCMANLGLLAMEEDNLDEAQEYLERALSTAREVKWKFSIAFCLAELSNLFYLQGKLEAYKQNVRESLSFKNDIAESHNGYILTILIGSLYCYAPQVSARLLGVVTRFYEGGYPYYSPAEKQYYRRAETHVRKELSNAAFEAAFTEGQKMSVDEALELVLKTAEEM